MESKNLVICDPETKFASAFAQYLTRQKELAVRVRTCSALSYVLAIQEKEKIDFLFISSEYPEDSRKQVKAGMVFVIAPEREVALENREVPIYKYQPGDQILAEMIRQCSMSGDEKQIFLKITGKKNCRVIAVYSPVRRIGKTTYAIRLGRKLAKEANVLYLGMETYGGEGGHFPEGTQTLADVLYYARQEQSNIGTVLTTIVRHSENLDYIVPMPVSEDIKEIDSEEWIRLIQKIIEQGKLIRSGKRFVSREKLEDVIQQIVAGSNRIVNEASPIVDARLPDGSRVNVVLGPIALNGPIVTIRKFSKEAITMKQLIRWGSICREVKEFLVKLVRAGYNIFISGGTGSGKTTFLNALSQYIPKDERIITIEDNAELRILDIPNLVTLEARCANLEGTGEITIRELIRTALRMRPNRIIVGEVRGAEAIDMLQALICTI